MGMRKIASPQANLAMLYDAWPRDTVPRSNIPFSASTAFHRDSTGLALKKKSRSWMYVSFESDNENWESETLMRITCTCFSIEFNRIRESKTMIRITCTFVSIEYNKTRESKTMMRIRRVWQIHRDRAQWVTQWDTTWWRSRCGWWSSEHNLLQSSVSFESIENRESKTMMRIRHVWQNRRDRAQWVIHWGTTRWQSRCGWWSSS